jgi:hypothetical protein
MSSLRLARAIRRQGPPSVAPVLQIHSLTYADFAFRCATYRFLWASAIFFRSAGLMVRRGRKRSASAGCRALTVWVYLSTGATFGSLDQG